MAVCLMTPVDSMLKDNRKRMLKELYASSSRKRQALNCGLQFVAACESGEEGSGDNWSCQQSSPSSDSPCSSHVVAHNRPTLPVLTVPDELDGTWLSPRNNSRQSSPLLCQEAQSRVCRSCHYGARPSGKSVESTATNPAVLDCACQGSSRRQPVELKTLSEMALALRLSTSVLLTSALLYDAAVLASANQGDGCSVAVEDERVQLAATCLFVAQKDLATGSTSEEQFCERLSGASSTAQWAVDADVVASKLEWAETNVKAFSRLHDLEKSVEEDDDSVADSSRLSGRQKIWSLLPPGSPSVQVHRMAVLILRLCRHPPARAFFRPSVIASALRTIRMAAATNSHPGVHT